MEYMEVLKRCYLFQGLEDDEINAMLTCMSARTVEAKRGTYLLSSGEQTGSIGVILSGCIHIVKDDFWGNRVILSEVQAGDMFGETYACVGETLEVSAVAAQDSQVLKLDVSKLLTVCTSGCAFHSRIIRNLVNVLARKNLMLTGKMDHMAKKTTREKLLSYLSAQSKKTGSPAFTIPFNRQQLADYLGVDRSAMSTELGRMQQDGLLTYEKNRFYLLEAMQ